LQATSYLYIQDSASVKRDMTDMIRVYLWRVKLI
jgi:hypothetical protein